MPVVFQSRFERAGVLAIEEIDHLCVELPPAGGAAWPPRGAQINAREHRQPRARQVVDAAESTS